MKFASVILGLCFLAGLMPGRGLAQTDLERKEYEIRQGLLYNIIGYVEWPKDSPSNQPPTIRIALLGQMTFPEALEVLDGKERQGRKLVVKRIARVEEAADCQVVFISASEKPRLTQIVSELKNRPILTVGEVEGFAERGEGIVNLVAGQNRINLEINREVAKEARLRISSELLKLRMVKVFPR